MKNVQILAYNTSNLTKDSLQGTLDLEDIAFMIYIEQSTLKKKLQYVKIHA